MARGFNEKEKNLITQALIEQGKKLFSQYGFHKTSIREITQRVGIAQGTFYKFFQSKEALYFTILEQEEEKIKKQLAQIDFFQDNTPKEAIKQTLLLLIKTVEANPLIRDLYFGNHLQQILKKLPPETLEKHFNQDTDSLTLFIDQWKKEGITITQDPEIVAGIFRSLFLLTLHQQEIGANIYEDTIEVLIDLIVDGIVQEE